MRTLFVIILFMVFLSFDQQSHDFSPKIPATYHYVDIDESMLNYREKVYLPLYSKDYLEKKHEINLMASVKVENKSRFEPIYLLAIDYYDCNGNLSERLIKKPVKIYPFESTQFILNNNLADEQKGENIIVDWGTVTFDKKPEIYMDMILNTPKGPVSYKDNGITVSDQYEINDRRPL